MVVKTTASEFEALGKKYNLSAEQIEASIKVAAQEQAKRETEPEVNMLPTGFTAHDDWSGQESFRESEKGNYILSATPGRWKPTGVIGPHGGKISINVCALEVMK